MKKPYMKKIGVNSGFKIFYVNGYWVRNHLDKAFTNYGNSRNFDFIPKDEFWIDYENGNKKEAKYFIISFLSIVKSLEEGKTYEQAIRIADRIERRERSKDDVSLKRVRKVRISDKIIKKIHKKQLLKKYTSKLKIWLVKGDLVRSIFNLDFTEGGHGYVYPFIPKNEVWIDDDVYKKEIPFVLIHELHERFLMENGWRYDSAGGQNLLTRIEDEKDFKSAHFAAEQLEYWCRHHRKSVMRVLLKEINKNELKIKKQIVLEAKISKK